MSRRSPTLTFLGGAGTVTGSKTLLETDTGRILVDCGLFQGRKKLRLQNWDPLPVPAASIDAVVLTHAHIDHCGYLPRLVKQGFSGPVYCTPGTRRLAEIVLPDCGYLQEEEADFANRKGYSKHSPALPLYTRDEAVDSLTQLETVSFDSVHELIPGVRVSWRRAGHILGAASVDIRLTEPERHIVFSGDLGRSTHPLLLPPAPIAAADVVVTESTYGDENHPETDPREAISKVVNRAARMGGVVLIPAFAVDRTEIVLWYLDQLVADKQVPDLPVFVDSPMASRALEVYRSEALAASPEIRPQFHGQDLFKSLNITETRSVDDSKQLNARRGPMVIVSASGMATGGRIIHHLANRIGNDDNSVLLVGFQAPGTRGDALGSGAHQVKMFGHYYPVRAQVKSIALSAHADQNELVEWVSTCSSRPDTIYVNHGEQSASKELAEVLGRRLGLNAIAPVQGERVRVDKV